MLGAALMLAVVAAAILSVKALLAVEANHEAGLGIRAIQPWPVEFMRLLGFLAALPVALRASRVVRERIEASRRVAALAVGGALFALVHLLVMLGVRVAAHVNLDEAHAFNAARDLPYELIGAFAAYAMAVGTFAAVRRSAETAEENGTADHGDVDQPPEPDRPSLVCFADGGRTVDIGTDDLRAVCGSGNYVELIFAGRPRMMLRTTLAAAEAALAGRGFRRTHKSWLVRIAAVLQVERTASGDFRLDLGDGIEAPLSRRNRVVADELRREIAEPQRRSLS
jgi:hypothetical protein